MSKVVPTRPRLIPLSEASEQLSMTRQTVMNYVKKGKLKCVRLAKMQSGFDQSI